MKACFVKFKQPFVRTKQRFVFPKQPFIFLDSAIAVLIKENVSLIGADI
ncbi:MAG: hypothetical protein LBL74_01780 [Bacteroidales bacterium]|jgi:hypothetical protein|nr:hypothetical protein [Bacteroidales bacterium]